MNKAMKIENIEEYMKLLDLELSENFVYAYTEPTLMSFFILGAFAPLVNLDSFLLFFSSEEIILIALTLKGDFSAEHVRTPRENIESFKVKKGFFQYKIKLKLNGRKKMTFKVSKRILNASWQKENLSALDANNWYQS